MGCLSVDVIKRGGRRPTETFERHKLHASVLAACLSVRTPEGEAETTTHKVCEAVLAWLDTRPEVTSSDLRRKASDTLQTFHPEAAYLYQHHRLII